MDHPYSRTFSLMAVPNALGDAIECDARARGVNVPEPLPLEYGNAFGMMLRFRTGAGDASVLRLLWRKQESGWRITGYGVEVPLMKSTPRRDRGVRPAGGFDHRMLSSDDGGVKGHRR